MRDFLPREGTSFDYRGECYASLRDFCRRNGVDYARMLRLRRRYLRAWEDPAVAAAWILGHEAIDYVNEPKSPVYGRDLEMAYCRSLEHEARRSERRKAG